MGEAEQDMIETLNAWAGFVALVLASANTIWVWVRTSGNDTAARLQAIEDKVDKKVGGLGESLKGHDRRIQQVESEIKHLPSQGAVASLTVSITELNGRLSVLDSELEGLTRTVRRIDDHLRKTG